MKWKQYSKNKNALIVKAEELLNKLDKDGE